MLDMVSIMVLVVFVIDLSGILDAVEGVIGRSIPKPFSCSLCSTWWVNVGYLIGVGCFSLPMVAFAGVLAFFAPVVGGVMVFVREAIVKRLNK